MPPPESIGYTYASDPDTPRFLTTWSELRAVLGEVGTHEDRAVVRFFHQVGERRIAVEALGSARLDRLVLRWFDSELPTKAIPPWQFAKADRSRTTVHVPLGAVPADLDELRQGDYESHPNLDFTSVRAETVLTFADAVAAMQWFLTAWPDEQSAALEWVER